MGSCQDDIGARLKPTEASRCPEIPIRNMVVKGQKQNGSLGYPSTVDRMDHLLLRPSSRASKKDLGLVGTRFSLYPPPSKARTGCQAHEAARLKGLVGLSRPYHLARVRRRGTCRRRDGRKPHATMTIGRSQHPQKREAPACSYPEFSVRFDGGTAGQAGDCSIYHGPGAATAKPDWSSP